MTHDRKLWIGVILVLAVAVALLLWSKPVRAQDKQIVGDDPRGPVRMAPLTTACPPDAKSCKVLVLTPEQEQVLVQMIENTSVQGPYSQVAQAVKFFTDMIAKAPAGNPHSPVLTPAEKK